MHLTLSYTFHFIRMTLFWKHQLMAFYKCSVSIWTQVRLQVLTVGAAAELWPHRWEQRCLLLTFHFRDSLWNGRLGCRLVFPPFDRRRMNGSLLIPTFRCLDLWLFWLRVRGQFAGHAQGAQLRQWQSSVQVRRQLLLLTHVAALRLQRLTHKQYGEWMIWKMFIQTLL